MNDQELRREVLDQAVRTHGQYEDAKKVVEAAGLYFKFVKEGGDDA